MRYNDPITIRDIEAILQAEQDPCISIYLPTTRLSQQTDKDVITLKNLRREAVGQLEERGLSADEIAALMQPVDDLLEDRSFWPRLSDGLALFINPTVAEIFRVPLRLAERVTVGPRFVLKPLLPLLKGGATFYILALSQNAVRLFECSRFSVSEVPTDALPANMAEALEMRGREPDRLPNKQWQGDEGTKNLYRKYFRQIDRELRPLIRSEGAPLVLAGVDYLLPIYRDVSSYRHLATGEITGNPESFRADELHRLALPIVEPILDAPRVGALSKLSESLTNGHGSTDPAEILKAASDGRVATLLLDPNRDLLGNIAPDGTGMKLANGTDGTQIDLCGEAARWTTSNGGELVNCNPGELPDDAFMGATFRY